MQIHSDVVTSPSAGGAADSFDTVGTITTREDAVQLLGFFVSAGPVTGTAAEAFLGQYKFTQNTLGLATTKTGPPFEGGAPATNVGHRPHLPYWIPTKRGSKANPIGALDILAEFSTHVPDVAVASAVAIAGVYTAEGQSPQGFPEEVIAAYRAGMILGKLGLDGMNWDGEAVAAATTTAPTAITDLNIEADATGIVGFSQGWAPDAFGAEELIGFIRYGSSIPNFAPQEWLLPGSGAPLGTAVGVGFTMESTADYVTFFPKDKALKQTVSPEVVWVVAVTTSSPTVFADVGFIRPEKR